jgi:hypothetical protein
MIFTLGRAGLAATSAPSALEAELVMDCRPRFGDGARALSVQRSHNRRCGSALARLNGDHDTRPTRGADGLAPSLSRGATSAPSALLGCPPTAASPRRCHKRPDAGTRDARTRAGRGGRRIGRSAPGAVEPAPRALDGRKRVDHDQTGNRTEHAHEQRRARELPTPPPARPTPPRDRPAPSPGWPAPPPGRRERRRALHSRLLAAPVEQAQSIGAICACEEFLLVIYPVDLTPSSSQRDHLLPPASAGRSSNTRAAGSADGEIAGFRPLARGWASPSGRAFDRPPASQGTGL